MPVSSWVQSQQTRIHRFKSLLAYTEASKVDSDLEQPAGIFADANGSSNRSTRSAWRGVRYEETHLTVPHECFESFQLGSAARPGHGALLMLVMPHCPYSSKPQLLTLAVHGSVLDVLLMNHISSAAVVTVLKAAGARDQPAFAGAPSAGMDLTTAPGPASAEAAADILFTLSATGAVLADDALKLTGVTGNTLYSTSGSRAGLYATGMTNKLLTPHPLGLLACYAIILDAGMRC